MNNSIQNLEPRILWQQFHNLTQVPRPSKKEEKAVEFARNFAQEYSLEHFVDKVGNVIIRKPATAGYENHPGVILQAHLDMVPQKESSSNHNFETDPIQTYEEAGWVHAKGTTLGADNGIGVAAALAALIDPKLQHPELEVLLTVDEETGMTGANYLKGGLLKGKYFLNLDHETLGDLCIGCAGGINAAINLPLERVNAPENEAFEIKLTGFHGGHSGLDINLGRGNTNKILNRFLWKMARELNLQVASFNGGNMRNAIPREAVAIVCTDSADKLKAAAAEFIKVVEAEYQGVEEGIALTVTPVAKPATVLAPASQKALLNLVYALPNGAIRMVPDVANLVETSTNLAIVSTDENKAEVIALLRSSVESAKDDLAQAFVAVSESHGASIELSGSYPGWKPNFKSPILSVMERTYNELFEEKAEVMVVHAGLECGIFTKNYPDLDYISFGPTIRHPHSPSEKVNVESVEKFWRYLSAVLRNL